MPKSKIQMRHFEYFSNNVYKEKIEKYNAHRQQMKRRKTAVVFYVMIALNIGCHWPETLALQGFCYTAFYPLESNVQVHLIY